MLRNKFQYWIADDRYSRYLIIKLGSLAPVSITKEAFIDQEDIFPHVEFNDLMSDFRKFGFGGRMP